MLYLSLADQALEEVPGVLRPGQEAFMPGETEYQDVAGRRIPYAADLSGWAIDVIYGAGLTVPLPLATATTVDVAALRAATLRHTAKCGRL